MEILDVTLLEPKFKHSTIFKQFDGLLGGESFIIHNDHDPKPLYYQMIAERGKTFDWEYILEGPDFWEVKISKLNTEEKTTTIGELVAKDYRKAEVFSKFGLDFSCGGKKSLRAACNEKGIDEKEVTTALAEIERQPKSMLLDFNSLELDFFVDYIVNVHHKYVKENVIMLYEYSDKVANRHGINHPEVIRIGQLYKEIGIFFKAHMQKEETILFPYIKKLAIAKRNESKETPPFKNIGSTLKIHLGEHELIGKYMDEIREISNEFNPPEDACSSYKVLFSKLDEFDRDFHKHVHLENNILFPRVIQLEKELLK